MSRRRVSEGIRPSLGDRQGPTVIHDAHRVVMVVLGDFSRRGDGVRGLGRRRGSRHVCGEGSPRKLSRVVWFVCSAESLDMRMW
jgi:hypothetical protein